jgi:glucuronosyltransferase
VKHWAQGIPLLFLPIFGHDQKLNKARAIEKEYGVHVSYSNISAESITLAIKELLSNNKYRENAKIIAYRYNDRPMTAQETVVFWTEYAFRHKGADHLHSEAAQKFNYFQLRSWDVYLLIYCIIAFIFYIDFLILRGIWRKISGKTKTRKEKRH